MFEYLFEKFNKFYENIFHKYGIFLSKYYIYIIAASFTLNLALSFGFFKLNIIDDVDEIYGVQHSIAKSQERYFKTLFNTTDMFENKYSLHQLIDFGTWVEINFRVSSDKNSNILKQEYLNEIKSIHEQVIANVEYTTGNYTFKFVDVCAKRHEACMVDNKDMLTYEFMDFLGEESVKKYKEIERLKRRYAKRMNLTSLDQVPDGLNELKVDEPEFYVNKFFDFIPLAYFLGKDFYIIPQKSKEEVDFAFAKLFKLRYSLKSNHDDGDPNVKAWELELLKYMTTVKSNLTSFTYAVSHSLDVEMDRNIRLDLKFVAFTFILIMTFSILLMSIGSNVITSPGFVLPFTGVLSAVFGLTSAVGLLSLMGYAACGFIVMVPFLVLGVGINDMFIIYSAFVHTDEKASTRERISGALRKSGVSVSITSITDFVAFLIGLTADFRSVQIFCVYAAVAILFCFFYQITFFSGWLVVHAKRVKGNRNCFLWCIKHKVEKQQPEIKLNEDYDDDTLSHHIQTKSLKTCMLVKLYKLLQRTWMKLYKFLLRNKYGKCIVGFLFIAYISLSIWGASKMREGIDPTDLVSDDSHFKEYIVSNTETVHLNPIVMIIFDKPLNYTDKGTLIKIEDFLKRAQAVDGIRKDFLINWIPHFVPILDQLGEYGYNETLYDEIANDETFFVNDVTVRYNAESKQKEIVACRFYIQYKMLHFTMFDVNVMINLRKLAASETELQPIAYSNYFKHIERMEHTTPNIIQSFVIGAEIMYIISLLFVPDITSILCIISSMISIMVGLIACMHAWGLTLSPVTMTLLILSVGFCIDFSAHLTHAFIASVGRGSRSRRAYYACMRIGMPIFNSAVSTILGICVLAFSSSYFFMSFFKAIFILMVLGVLHSMLFLPVLLSLVGPHWSRHKQEAVQNNKPVNGEASNIELKNMLPPSDL